MDRLQQQIKDVKQTSIGATPEGTAHFTYHYFFKVVSTNASAVILITPDAVSLSISKVAAIIKGLGRHRRCSAALADLQCGFKSEFSFS